jgi:hypothetical protein
MAPNKKRRFNIDPAKFFYMYDTSGDWQGTILNNYIFDTRGDYIGFIHDEEGEGYEVYTAVGEWIGYLIQDGRVVRKRTAEKRPLLKDKPEKPAKPEKLPARAPLPPLGADLGFTLIDVLDWDPEIFKRLSDMVPDKE